MSDHHPEGPYIVWSYLAYEGWWPESYPSMEEAIAAAPRSDGCVTTGPFVANAKAANHVDRPSRRK